MPTRLKQILVGAAGCAIAVTMLWLGVWQMRVYESKEHDSALERAALPPVALLENVATDGTVGDVYARQVSASGTFLPTQQQILTDGRVLTALELADGRVLPVVRGKIPGGTAPGQPPDLTTPSQTPDQTIPEPAEGSYPPPAGEQHLVGIFMPSEPRSEDPQGAVRLAALAQQWPQHLLPGFLTLNAEGAHAHGLQPATVDLGTGEGSWQNYGYALQWWVFAGFAVFMTIRFVRALGRQGVAQLGDDRDDAAMVVGENTPQALEKKQ